MKYIITAILSVISSFVLSQTIQITYQEEMEFEYQENIPLIVQWENDEIIKSEYTYGYPINGGSIRYTFDFNNMKVKREEDNGKGYGFIFVDEWNIDYIISPWNYETQHFSCVASTPIGYFYTIGSYITGEPYFFKSHRNGNCMVGEITTNYGDFIIEEIE